MEPIDENPYHPPQARGDRREIAPDPGRLAFALGLIVAVMLTIVGVIVWGVKDAIERAFTTEGRASPSTPRE